MTNREELEKSFIKYLDEYKDCNISCFEANINDDRRNKIQKLDNIYAHHRTFLEQTFNKIFFEEMLPEVLKSVIPNKLITSTTTYIEGHNDCIEDIKGHAKNLYGIDL